MLEGLVPASAMWSIAGGGSALIGWYLAQHVYVDGKSVCMQGVCRSAHCYKARDEQPKRANRGMCVCSLGFLIFIVLEVLGNAIVILFNYTHGLGVLDLDKIYSRGA